MRGSAGGGCAAARPATVFAKAAVTSAVVIRAATRHDVDALVELRRAWAAERRGAKPDPGFAVRFRQWFDDGARQRRFWLAERGDRPVGMVSLVIPARLRPPGAAPGGRGYLADLYVVPDQRDEGVGRRLVDALIAHAGAAGLERVLLSPSEPSVPLLRRAGFGAADQVLLRPERPAPSRLLSASGD